MKEGTPDAGKGIESSSGSASCATAAHNPQTERQANLWSGLREISEILRIPVDAASDGCDIRFPHLHYKEGQRIFTIGQEFDALHVLRTGFMKSAVIDAAGNEQVLAFPMSGDLLGADGIDTGRYQSETVALSDCVLIPLQFKKLLSVGRTYPEFEMRLYGVISRELVREHTMIRMLTGLNAETKVARFLLALSQRYVELGYSGKCFNLRMTRHDIGRYLGLSMETVCRTLNAFAELRLIDIRQREVTILDSEGLNTMRRLKKRRGHEAHTETS